MNARTLAPTALIALLGALVLSFALATGAHASAPPPVDLTIRLLPGPGIPNASGEAEFHSRGDQRSLAVHLNATPRLHGAVVEVIVGGRHVGRFTLNDRGDGRLYLSTAEGEWVPESVYDQRIEIIGPHGIVVAGGHFPPAP